MVATVVVVASLARVHYKASEVAMDYSLDVALAATYDLDVVALEFVFRTLAHVAREHHLYAHGLHYRGNVRLAATALGRV